ncbi:tRNA(Ile)-lysidine synthase [Streptococcus saliviloxodontae]|uniref:tRNA(Ile)-lysidine synthase n=2 Tax=Streptococcus saliviloxodontae TaxID=1349416 RepID=A0ABS2PKH9_9STRE|nr:tRNA lysidine(34) synthetase TilS [Streptococcus saliviloxodontae]MBM7635861.1 tRNA(Ile)-lysidine synthase [Streptococcus saliviloxodontae]
MYSKIYQLIKPKQFFKNHRKVLVAVSTGIDSMNLLAFLNQYQKTFGIDLAIAHVNHHQRVQSDQEESFIRNWATEHKIPIFVADFQGDFSEKAARDFRYAFFARVMQTEGYTALVTAHHRDDQAETILMRLIRGSHLRHLIGIREVQPFAGGQLIRPFLSLSKSDLPNIIHFEDSSNHSPVYFRNRVRQSYLPILETENPQLRSQLISLSEQVITWKEALTDLTKGIDGQDLAIFRSQTPAIQSILLEQYLETISDLQLTKSQFKDVLHLLQRPGNYVGHLKQDYRLVKDYQRYQIIKIGLETDSSDDWCVLDYGESCQYSGYLFRLALEQSSGSRYETILLPFETSLILRHRQPGDYLQLANGRKKLRRLFIDEKIPLSERSRAIVGEQEGEIIFVIANGRTYLRNDVKNDIMRAKLYIQKEEW